MRRYIGEVVVGSALLLAMSYLIAYLVGNPEVRHLPSYTLSTVSRIVITLVISIVWGVLFGILAATNKTASFFITPLVDILQSVPILGYFPMVLGFLLLSGPWGIELSILVLLFTSMAWSIFFGVLGAVHGIPENVVEASKSFGLKGWSYIRHVVLPSIAPAVISGANLAWSDGWFFIIAAEYIQYRGSIFVPSSGGLGYLLARAAYYYKDMNLSLILLLYITVIVLVVNTLTWHRLMERAGPGVFRSILSMDLSGIGKIEISKMASWLRFERRHGMKPSRAISQRFRKYSRLEKLVSATLLITAVFIILYREIQHLPTLAMILDGLKKPPAEELVNLPVLISLTMGRLTIAYAVSLTVAIGLGILAAEHRRLAAVIYPIYDIGQGVPILALFPVLFLGLSQLLGAQRFALEVTCIVMLVLDMIWYMFINVTNAVKNIPSDVKEVGQLFGFRGMKRLTHLIIPSIIPSIVTGSILSWGTGWNTIIFAEYLPSTEPAIQPVSVPGIGSLLDKAGYTYGNTIVLVIIIGIIAAIVLSMEGLLWRRLLRRFEKYRVEV